MQDILKQLSDIGIVPVIKIDDVEKAVPLARALADGGLPCAEVTFRTAEGEEAIRRIASALPDVLVGAGTVLTTAQVDRAVDAGAKFIVSPGLNPKVVAYCLERGVPVVPGCANPSDMELAIELGLETVKFFPAEQAGGVAYLKAVSGPYPKLTFMPTGGVNAQNLCEYLAFDKIIACGGSWMVKPELIAAGKFDEIEALAREAVSRMLGFTVAHIGLNSADADEAARTARLFAALLGAPLIENSSGYFAGTLVETKYSGGRGRNGHIAIGATSVDRAAAHLLRRGFAMDEQSRQRDAKGHTKFLYLRDEIGGFAVHLVRK